MSTAPLRSNAGPRADRKAKQSRPDVVHSTAAVKTLSTSTSHQQGSKSSSASSWWTQPTALYSSFVDALPGRAAFSVPWSRPNVEPVALSKSLDEDTSVGGLDEATRASRKPADKVCH